MILVCLFSLPGQDVYCFDCCPFGRPIGGDIFGLEKFVFELVVHPRFPFSGLCFFQKFSSLVPSFEWRV